MIFLYNLFFGGKFMKKLGFIGLFLLYSCLGPWAFAMSMSTLYQAKVFVKTQTAEEQLKATRSGLAQVFVKITGSEQVLTNPRINSYLDTAENFLQEFGYTKFAHSEGYELDLQFDSKSIIQSLQNINEPVWGPNRPLILIWINYENNTHHSEIIANHSDHPIFSLLNKRADLRGIPILFPIMDMTDMNNVSNEDISSMLTENLKKAATRYKCDGILIGNINENGEELTTQWKLLVENDSWDWALTGKMDQVVKHIINLTTNTLSAKFANVSTHTTRHEVSFRVTGINKRSDFEKCFHYIQNLASVYNAEVTTVSGNNVLFQISLNSSEDDFQKAIGQGQKLLPTPDSHSQIIYQWNP